MAKRTFGITRDFDAPDTYSAFQRLDQAGLTKGNTCRAADWNDSSITVASCHGKLLSDSHSILIDFFI
jgi:hypothetical protein